MPYAKCVTDNAAGCGMRLSRLEHLESMLKKWIEEENLRQALVLKVNRCGKTVFEGCYGTNTKLGGHVGTDTLFSVASITKPVVSTMLFALAEDGVVDLAETVSRYLPGFDKNGREKICIWHFLTHTSGLTDEEMGEYADGIVKEKYGLTRPGDEAPHEEWEEFHKKVDEKVKEDLGSRPDFDEDDTWGALVADMPAKREPRKQMTYCNYGYNMLAKIIVKTSGKRIDEYMAERVTGPLAMPDTHFIVPDDKWERILGRGEKCEGYPFINSERYYRNENGAGGLKTTPDDIMRFCEMVRRGGELDGVRVLSKPSVKTMVENHNADLPNDFDAWALGWNYRGAKKDDTTILRSPRCIDHGGWAGTKIMIDPDYDLCVVLFGADYAENNQPLFGKLTNILYSALD